MCIGTRGPTMKPLLTTTPFPRPAGAAGAGMGRQGVCTHWWPVRNGRENGRVIGMAETNASEGALEVGKFLCKG